MESAIKERGRADSAARSWTAPAASVGSWAALAGLLLAEVVVLTTRFDSESLVSAGRWWSPALAYARYLPQALVALGAAALVYVGPRLGASRGGAGATRPALAGRAPLYLAAHLAAYAGFLTLTQAVWEGDPGRSPWAPAWLAAWFACGLGTFGLLVAVAVPPGAWLPLARRSSGWLPAALGFALAACLAGRFAGSLWGPLHGATFRAVGLLLRLTAGDVTLDPEGGLVGASGFVVAVAPECSGSEGIGLIWVFLAAYLWAFRRELRFPRALWLIPLGTVVIWLANACRIAALVWIGARVSPAVALGGFHSQAGWLAFNAVALGLVALSRWSRAFALPREGPAAGQALADAPAPTVAYLAPLLALVGTVMVTTALSAGRGFDAAYPLRVLAVAAALMACRRGYAGWRFRWSWPAVGLGVLAFALWVALEPLHPGGTPEGGGGGLAASLAALPRPVAALWLLARVVGSVVTVPIAEELAFRGYLPRRLIAADFTEVAPGRFTWLAFLGSSLLFGLFHGRWVAGTLAGMVYALALRRRGDLGEAMLAHATTNALIAASVLGAGQWSLWL